jgi:hypothetical protein
MSLQSEATCGGDDMEHSDLIMDFPRVPKHCILLQVQFRFEDHPTITHFNMAPSRVRDVATQTHPQQQTQMILWLIRYYGPPTDDGRRWSLLVSPSRMGGTIHQVLGTDDAMTYSSFPNNLLQTDEDFDVLPLTCLVGDDEEMVTFLAEEEANVTGEDRPEGDNSELWVKRVLGRLTPLRIVSRIIFEMVNHAVDRQWMDASFCMAALTIFAQENK